MPGSTTQVRGASSTDTSRLQYLLQSMTTAWFVAWPARLVPPPRETTGALCWRQTPMTDSAAATERGSTTAIGGCR